MISFFLYLVLALLIFQDSITRYFTDLGFLTNIDEILIIICFIYSIIKIFQNKKMYSFQMKLLLFIIVFAGIGILSCYLNSAFNFKHVMEAMFLSIKFFLGVFAFSFINVSKEGKMKIIKKLNVIGIICAIVGIFNFLFPNIYSSIFSFALVTERNGLTSVTSLFYHPGRYGWFMLFLAIMNYCIYKFEKKQNNLRYMLLFLVFALLSFRVKVIMGIISFFIIDLLMDKKINLKKFFVLIFITLVSTLLFKNILINNYNLYFNSSSSGDSARTVLIQKSLVIMKDYFPLGVGFGYYGSWYSQKYYSIYYKKYNMDTIWGLSEAFPSYISDTYWPSIIGETGILGLCVLIYILIIILRKLKNKYTSSTGFNKMFSNFAILILFQTIIESVGEQSFNSVPEYILVSFFVGITLNTNINRLKEKN